MHFTQPKSQPIASLFFLVFLSFFCVGFKGKDFDRTTDTRLKQFALKRQQMVEQQIKARGINEKRILGAFLKVERHRFVSEKYLTNAYEDRPLPIGKGQTISQPFIVAYMTYILNLKRSDRVLEIGTGSGYQAAILGELSDHVYSIEVIPSLGQKAEGLLQELGYTNIKVKIGDGYQGWQEHAPYDAIIVTCAPSHVPKSLKDQLKEGGRMIIPVGESYRQNLVLLEKTDGKLTKKKVFPVLFVPMVDDRGKKY